MTTNNRISRFDNDGISVIQQSGSIKNDYLLENGTLRTNIDSTDPHKSLASFPVSFYKYSNQKIYEFFDSEFSEFVEETDEPNEIDIFTQEQLLLLQNRLDELTEDLDDAGGFVALSSAQKDVIIELRILLGQGETESDFSPDFPYNPWPEYLRQQQRSRTGGYGYGYPSTRVVRGDVQPQRNTSGLLATSSPIPITRTSNLVLGEQPTEFVGPVIRTTPVSVIQPAASIEPVSTESADTVPEVINDLPQETITVVDIKTDPVILTENTLIISETETVEEPVKYDDNNNIVSEDEDNISPSEPIVKPTVKKSTTAALRSDATIKARFN